MSTEKKLKPFDLKAALAGAKVVCGNGREVNSIHYFKKSYGPYKVAADIEGCSVAVYTVSGVYAVNQRSDEDLFMADTTRTVYMNLYPENIAYYYDTPEQAHAAAADNDDPNIVSEAVPVTLET